MKFTDSHEFDVSSDTVIKMFSDPDYFTGKYEALGFSNIEVLEHTQDGDEFSITVRYEAPSDAPVPGFAKKFMAETNVVTQTDCWNVADKTGELTAEIKGLPATIKAQMELVDDGKGMEDPLNLVVEIKGYRREDAKEKKATMETYWVPGVNHLGHHGRWAFAEFTDVFQMQHDFAKKVEIEFIKMIEAAANPTAPQEA